MTSRNTRPVTRLIAVFACLAPAAQAYPQDVPPPGKWTVLIHGRTDVLGSTTYDELADPTDDAGWMGKVAEEVTGLNPSGVNIYKMNIDTFTIFSVQGTLPSDESKHHVVMFDWTETSDIPELSLAQEGAHTNNGDAQAPEGLPFSDDGYAYAAGDALYAFLRHHDAAEDVQALIGHSRGAVVASEVARRLILRGAPPEQVLYLDGEGEGGTCTGVDYIDQVFDAWAAPGAPVDWRNIRAEAAGCDVGGAPAITGAHNLNLSDTHTHGGDIHDDPPPVWSHLLEGDNLTVQNGLFVVAGDWTGADPDTRPLPTQADTFDPPTSVRPPILYNGHFEWGSLAGWRSHGGSGAAITTGSGLSFCVGSGGGASQTHSWFYMPPGEHRLGFSFDVTNASNDDTLRVTIEAPGISPTLVNEQSLSEQGLFDVTGILIPEIFSDSLCRVHFTIEFNTLWESCVTIEDVAIGAETRANQAERILTGAASGDGFGVSVAGAGDVDGDGVADIVVGAQANDAAGENAGAAYVYSGAAGERIHTFLGDRPNDLFGAAVAGVGDVNGDNRDDIIVGAPVLQTDGKSPGYASVFSGATGNEIHKLTDGASGADFGAAVGSTSDVDGDGVRDLIIGAPFVNEPGDTLPGSVYLYSGATGALLRAFTGESQNDRFGRAVAGVSDLDNDGAGDVLVGAFLNDAGGVSAGRAYVLSGATGATIHTMTGDAAGDQFGWSVDSAGDVNQDGSDDLIVGAWANDAAGTNSGAAYVYCGATGDRIYTFTGDMSGDELGLAVAGAGDLDLDGVPDLIVGANQFQNGGSGYVSVYSGASGALLHRWSGELNEDEFGGRISALRDTNGDGLNDLLVGAPVSDAGGANAGRAYILTSLFPDPAPPPRIASLTAAPDPVEQGASLTLSISGVDDPTDPGGDPAFHEFWRDADGDKQFNPDFDQRLFASSDPDVAGVTVNTAAFTCGMNRFFARVQSATAPLVWSAYVVEDVLIIGPPVIESLQATPDPAVRGQFIDLQAIDVLDPKAVDGEPAAVEFFRDSNGNGALEPGSDSLLAVDGAGDDGWGVNDIDTSGLVLGTHVFFARAQSAVEPSIYGDPVRRAVAVFEPPSIGSLAASPDPVEQGQPLTLEVVGVDDPADPEGHPALVAFYVDSNRNGFFDPQTDLQVGTDADPQGGWTVQAPTDQLPLGANRFFARARSSVAATGWSPR